jgi:hypothetical protein
MLKKGFQITRRKPSKIQKNTKKIQWYQESLRDRCYDQTDTLQLKTLMSEILKNN